MPSTENNISPPEPIRILRSALPYLGFSMQHQLSLALKFMELESMMHQALPKPSGLSMTRGSAPEETPSSDSKASLQHRLKMLQSIRGACNPEHTQYIDTIMQTFRMQAMIQNMPAPVPAKSEPVIPFLRGSAAAQDVKREEASHGNELENTLTSMLTPSQQAMFQSFSTILKQSNIPKTQGGTIDG